MDDDTIIGIDGEEYTLVSEDDGGEWGFRDDADQWHSEDDLREHFASQDAAETEAWLDQAEGVLDWAEAEIGRPLFESEIGALIQAWSNGGNQAAVAAYQQIAQNAQLDRHSNDRLLAEQIEGED